MKTLNLLTFFMMLLVAVSGCTVTVSMDDTNQSNDSNQTGSATNLTASMPGSQVVNQSAGVVNTNNQSTHFDLPCSSTTTTDMLLTTTEQDFYANAKQIQLCSINKDVMNGVNNKYYRFTLSQPKRVYLMVDGFETGAFQVGITEKTYKNGVNGEPVIYSEDLPAGTYTAYVRVINSLGSSCVSSNCCFEITDDDYCWWIKGSPSTGIIKLGYRLTLSTSERAPSSNIEMGSAMFIPVSQSCQSFNSRTVPMGISQYSAATAFNVSLCDKVSDIFDINQYQYYSITLAEQENVKITLAKSEGNWQVGIDGYGWESSSLPGSESIVYTNTLPAGTYKVWAMVTNVAANSGSDWSCRQIVASGTCYWTGGNPPSGTTYLTYDISFDTE